MAKSKLFYSEDYKKIEKKIIKFINAQDNFMSTMTVSSPRAAGDAIQSVLADNFQEILGEYCGEYNSSFARRAMADMAFTDKEGNYYVIDVKTHRMDTKFNMPNLTSVERLARFYEEDVNYFIVLNVAYNIDETKIKVEKVNFIPIEFLSWECLTIGALGWGQIQIANSNNIIVDSCYSRKKWMLEFCDIMLEFYPKEVVKISERTERFRQIKSLWAKKEE
ncbi:MAG: hypothetical protein ABH886_04435 [Candidatus Desantisbacteria bacterium]